MIAKNGKQESIVAALDIGSSKVACLIAEITENGQARVLGVGNRTCDGGVSSGTIVDMRTTENAIKAAVDQAEKMAGHTISDVLLTFSGGDPKSQVIEVTVDVTGHAVSSDDIDKALTKAKAEIDPEQGALLHAFPAAYAVDGNYGVKAPKGMYGKKLSLALLVITVDPGPLQNLQACVRRAHLNIPDVVLTPFAAGLSTLVEDEMKMGAACIDIGEGTTGISIFAQGALVHAETLPIGGGQITDVIARNLLTPFDQAERLKTFNGAAIVDPADERQEMEVQQVGEAGRDSLVRMPRSSLTSVIQAELELLFATISEHLDASGFSGVTGRRVVLTGGVANCEGIRDLAGKMLNRRVRIGKPQFVDGLPQAAQSPSFAGVVGLVLYAASGTIEDVKDRKQEVSEPSGELGALGRITRWLRDNF
ncbi:cell division protein FtsA [Kordiimonas aquimaris]|uniref:cell division protein FtsA n=1 Tax=Kordiimonas aquimaris TaxID=707591 RepID=UPI0021D3C528|nr:cell division protein FtsA [Kordiimonas aquimaris]